MKDILMNHAKTVISPVLVSVVTIGLMKLGIFVTHADLEQSLRSLEHDTQLHYATRNDVKDIKAMILQVNNHLIRMDNRLNKLVDNQSYQNSSGHYTERLNQR
ncbi:MAG: hypothetical protein AAGI66_09285 [Cyanobacteria bacterium P01_H01_bin.74]